MDKWEYIKINPDSADFCWCCQGNWDLCQCPMGPEGKCPSCGRCRACCLCFKPGGMLFTILDFVRVGKITTEQALQELKERLEPSGAR